MHANFSELLVILLVALLVIKPQHLPRLAFTLGRWVKLVRQGFAKIQREMDESK